MRRVLAPVVDDQECMAFIAENKQYFVSLVGDAGADASDFKDKVRVMVTESDCNVKVIEFADAIADT